MLNKDRNLSLFIILTMLILNVCISVCLYIAVMEYLTEIEDLANSISENAMMFVNWLLGWFGVEAA